MRKLLIAASTVVTACISAPPAPPAPREATAINAPFNKTWDALIDVFSGNTIPIRTLDRASGFVATDLLGVPAAIADRFADCGQVLGNSPVPTNATYNVVVRPMAADSTKSTVRVTVRWINADSRSHSECTTTGTWENSLERQIQSLAEDKAAPASRSGTPLANTIEWRCYQQDAAIVGRDQSDAEVYEPDAARTGCVVHYCHFASSTIKWDKRAALDRCRAESLKRPD